MYIALFRIPNLVIDDMNINELCVQDSEKSWKFSLFDEASSVMQLLIPFAIMTSDKFNNDIFHQRCKEQVKQLNVTNTWSEISDAIEAVFDYCSHILEKLKDLSVTLYEVDTLFATSKCTLSTSGVIFQEISKLDNALSFSQEQTQLLAAANTFSLQSDPCITSSILASMSIGKSGNSSTTQIENIATVINSWRGLAPLLLEAKNFADVLKDFGVDAIANDVLLFSNIVSMKVICSNFICSRIFTLLNLSRLLETGVRF